MAETTDEPVVAAFSEDEDEGAPKALELGATEAEDEEKAETPKSDAVTAQLMQEIEKLRQQVSSKDEADAELRAELAILRSQARQSQGTPEAEEPVSFDADEKQKLLAVMAKDPVAAIEDIVRKLLSGTEQKVSREITDRVGGALRLSQEQQTDQTMAIQAFPELSENDAYVSRTQQLYRLTIQEAGKPFAGAYYLAAAAAKAEMERKGTWKPTGSAKEEGKGEKVSLTLRERVRQNADKLIDERPPDRKEGFDPASEYSEAELRGIRAACKRYGITEKQYFSRFVEQRKKDANYGRRAG